MHDDYLGNTIEDTTVGARGVCIGFMHQLDEDPILSCMNVDGKQFWVPLARARVIDVENNS